MRLFLDFEDGSEKELDGVSAFYPVSRDLPNAYMVVTGGGCKRYDNVVSFHVSA